MSTDRDSEAGPLPRRGRRTAVRAAILLAGLALLHGFLLPGVTSTAGKPVTVASIPPAPPQWGQLEAALGALRTGFRGTVAYYVEDLQTGRTISWNEAVPIPAASLIKLPIAVAVFEQNLAGKVSLDEVVTLKGADKAGGSGVLRRYPVGTRLTVESLLELMIQKSDNTATNLITDLLGLEEINASCARQGLAATCMPRYIMDLEARDRKIENFTSAADMARLLRALYARRILDEERCRQLLEILKGQKVRDRLPRYLPKDAVVANKTGLMNKLCHDVGIIYGQNHDYLVAVLTADFPSYRYAKDAIGKVGRAVYLYDRGEPLTPPKRISTKRPKAPARKPVQRSGGRGA